ncbi:hypothetical protein T484DRAFT_2292968 [Baffinella frigidus]|nr:hypothetical protein T484DRAFT_2292968 [Cryptophyta sp. CCMP2293]
MEDHIVTGSWRRAAAGVGVVVLGCACVAAASLGGSRPGSLAEASAGGSVVDKAAGPSSGGRSQRGWGFSNAVINDFDQVLQGHVSAAKGAPTHAAKKPAPNEDSYLLRMGLVQHRGGSLIGGMGDAAGAGTLVSTEDKANAAARLQKLSYALEKTRGGRLVGQVNIGQSSGAGKLIPAEAKGVNAARTQALAYALKKAPGGRMVGQKNIGQSSGAGKLLPVQEEGVKAARTQVLAFALQKIAGGRLVGLTNIGQSSGAGKLEEEGAGADAADKGVAGEGAGGAAEGEGVEEQGARTQSLVNAYRFSEGIPLQGPALPHSGWPTILKLPCWVSGRNPSTLELESARAHQIGEPKQTGCISLGSIWGLAFLAARARVSGFGLEHLPRKSVGLTWENKSVHTEFVKTFRNFDFSVGRMFTYELKK